MSFIVAIDGPAGTGKGTLAKQISEELNFTNIDTGAIYRCVALYVIRNGIEIDNKEQIIDSLDSISIDMTNENGTNRVYLNNEDVSVEIRSKEVSETVSFVSSIKEVRTKMIEIQRKLAEGKDIVMEGRDITTVVFPDADVKIYLDADENIRAKRRYDELVEKGTSITFEEVLENIRTRDNNDMTREYGALKIAEDAIYLDTSNLSIEEVKNKVIDIIKEKTGEE